MLDERLPCPLGEDSSLSPALDFPPPPGFRDPSVLSAAPPARSATPCDFNFACASDPPVRNLQLHAPLQSRQQMLVRRSMDDGLCADHHHDSHSTFSLPVSDSLPLPLPLPSHFLHPDPLLPFHWETHERFAMLQKVNPLSPETKKRNVTRPTMVCHAMRRNSVSGTLITAGL